MKRMVKPGLALLLFIFTFLVMLPASWVDYGLQHWTQNTLAMTATSGTFWKGQGTLQAILPRGEAVTLSPASWKIAPGELLMLRLHATLSSSQTGGTLLDVALSPGGIRVHEAKLGLPAALLGVLSPTLRGAALDGQMELTATDFGLEGNQAHGKLQAIWMGATSDLSSVRPLGNYQLQVEGQGQSLDFHLTTLGGYLNLSGAGSWQAGSAPNIVVTAVPMEAKRQELASLLRMLGRGTAPGTYQLTLGGNLRAGGA